MPRERPASRGTCFTLRQFIWKYESRSAILVSAGTCLDPAIVYGQPLYRSIMIVCSYRTQLTSLLLSTLPIGKNTYVQICNKKIVVIVSLVGCALTPSLLNFFLLRPLKPPDRLLMGNNNSLNL